MWYADSQSAGTSGQPEAELVGVRRERLGVALVDRAALAPGCTSRCSSWASRYAASTSDSPNDEPLSFQEYLSTWPSRNARRLVPLS